MHGIVRDNVGIGSSGPKKNHVRVEPIGDSTGNRCLPESNTDNASPSASDISVDSTWNSVGPVHIEVDLVPIAVNNYKSGESAHVLVSNGSGHMADSNDLSSKPSSRGTAPTSYPPASSLQKPRLFLWVFLVRVVISLRHMQLLWLKIMLPTPPLVVSLVNPPLIVPVVLTPLLQLPKLPLAADVEMSAILPMLLTSRVQTPRSEWKILR